MHSSRRVTPSPSPCSVTEPASADDEGRRVVATRCRRDLLQGREPVLGAPSRGGGRIDGDHRKPGVRRHLDEAVTEPRGRQTGDEAAEGLPSLPARRPVARALAAFLAALDEVEVLDDDGSAVPCLGRRDELGDRPAEPTVSCRCRQPRELDGTVNDRPTGFPDSSGTPAARWPWLRSTASTRSRWSSSRAGCTSPASKRHDASRYQRCFSASKAMS